MRNILHLMLLKWSLIIALNVVAANLKKKHR